MHVCVCEFECVGFISFIVLCRWPDSVHCDNETKGQKHIAKKFNVCTVLCYNVYYAMQCSALYIGLSFSPLVHSFVRFRSVCRFFLYINSHIFFLVFREVMIHDFKSNVSKRLYHITSGKKMNVTDIIMPSFIYLSVL